MSRTLFNKLKPKIRDVFDCIYPLHVFCRIFGFTNLKLVEHSNRRRSKIDPVAVARQIIQILLIGGLAYIEIGNEFGANFLEQRFSKIVLIIEEVVGVILSMTSTFIGLIFATKITSILNRISGVDVEFKKLNVVAVDWWIWYTSLGFVIICCTFSGVLMISNVINRDFHQPYAIYNILKHILSVAPEMMNLMVQYQYSTYTLIIRSRYAALNQYLKSILEGASERPHLRNVWISEDLQPDIKKQRKFVRNTSDSLFIVDTVASYHIKLADIAAILNQAFCVQLLLLITTSFLGIVTALFLIAINFKQPVDEDSSNYNFVFTAWAFSNTMALLVVVHTTCGLCDEANKCPRILHKIRNNTNDPKLHTTIEMYSLQMYHNRLQFHVCGLFPLDYTLLYTIVAGVTTHLVILIQFNSFDYGKRASNESVILNYTSTE